MGRKADRADAHWHARSGERRSRLHAGHRRGFGGPRRSDGQSRIGRTRIRGVGTDGCPEQSAQGPFREFRRARRRTGHSGGAPAERFACRHLRPAPPERAGLRLRRCGGERSRVRRLRSGLAPRLPGDVSGFRIPVRATPPGVSPWSATGHEPPLRPAGVERHREGGSPGLGAAQSAHVGAGQEGHPIRLADRAGAHHDGGRGRGGAGRSTGGTVRPPLRPAGRTRGECRDRGPPRRRGWAAGRCRG